MASNPFDFFAVEAEVTRSEGVPASASAPTDLLAADAQPPAAESQLPAESQPPPPTVAAALLTPPAPLPAPPAHSPTSGGGATSAAAPAPPQIPAHSPGGAAASPSSAALGGSDGFSSLDQAALPFITVDADDKFHINAEAVEYLRSLHGRVCVVAIAGIYRTGKSYLLNQLMGKNAAFAVGPTVRATTKGIWIWGRAMAVEGSPDTHVVFMDTEGLGSTVRSETYDARIFALALLLSSYFIYNSFGTIDGAAISKLSLVVNLTKFIRVRAATGGKEDSGMEYNQFFPHFLWVVRDFAVKLEREGKKISARDYLEDALKPEDGASEAGEAKNAVRMLIRSFFPERECVTLVRPVSDEKALMNLSAVPFEQLRPEFRTQVDGMRRRLFAAVRPKTLYGKPLNGAMLASLAEAYVGALNAGGTPTISSAWDRVVDAQCGEAVEGAVGAYVTTMRSALATRAPGGSRGGGSDATAAAYHPGVTVVEEADFHAAHSESSLAAQAFFSLHAVQDPEKTPPYEAKLRAELEAEHAKLRRANDEASTACCTALLGRLHAVAAEAMRQAAAPRPPAGAAASALSSASGEDAFQSAIGDVVSAAVVSRAYRAASDALHAAYTADARGPAKAGVLCHYLATRLPLLLLEAAAATDGSITALVAAAEARLADASASLATARGREAAAAEQMAQERSSFETALTEQARSAAKTGERLRFQAESKAAELERLSSKFDRLQASSEAAAGRAEDAAVRASSALSSALQRNAELQAIKIASAADSGSLGQRLADAEAARGDADRREADQRARLVEESKAAAVMQERVRAAENETIRLREQTELLWDSVKVQKDLVATKQDELEEIEYQLAVAKGKVAQVESERSARQEEIDTLASLAASLKGSVVAAGKSKGRMPTLSRAEQAVFDRLQAAPV